MPVYEYRAFDLDEAAVAGTIVADTPRQARDLLREKCLTIAQVQAVPEAGQKSWGGRLLARRNSTEAVIFVRELATILGAGIALLPALQTLARQHRGRFRVAIQRLTDQVSAGAGLADAMARQPEWFDQLCVAIVRVGENSGSLETALKRLSEFKEKGHQLRSRITSALIYPAIVCIVGVAVAVFLMTYVVPNLLTTLRQADKEMPAVTRIVQGISDFLVGWWWALLLGIAAVAAGLAALLRTPRGRLAADWLAIHIPVIGPLVRMENTARMAVVLAALLRSGLPFVEAVRITRQTLSNRVFQRALEDYEAAVSAGRDVAGPLEASGVFSPMAVQIVSVGQQSGRLEEMLDHLSESYNLQVATATGRLTAVLEPLLIVLLAGLIGFIAFATILPILEASNVL